MAKLYLLCGLPCAGKTTLAKKIEMDKGALRLTADEWMARIVGDGHDEAKRAAVEAIQWELAKRVLSLGIDVVVDFGAWSRTERDHFKSEAAAIGAETELIFLNVPLETLQERLAARNANPPPYVFWVTSQQLTEWSALFEAPTPDEF